MVGQMEQTQLQEPQISEAVVVVVGTPRVVIYKAQAQAQAALALSSSSM